MKTLIKLKIEKFIENNEEYFVATSEDLKGLVSEGKTIEEVIKIAEDVAKILWELQTETNNLASIKDIPSVFEYPLFMEV